MIPLSKTFWMLLLFLGIVLPAGTGALSFGIIMGVITPKLGERQANTASGAVSASNGIGNIVFSPAIQILIASGGLMGAMLFLSVPTLFLLPVTLWLCKAQSGQSAAPIQTEKKAISLKALFMDAFRNRTYRFLLIGFFTSGFHVAIIETHLFTQITTFGLSGEMAAYVFSIYGLATIVGSTLSGTLCNRVGMSRVLGVLYGSRCVIIVSFLLMPKTLLTVCIIGVLLGLTSAATIAPTSGLVNRTFGAARLGALFGFTYFVHQIGCFFSSWLGGVTISATGSYTVIWAASTVLSMLAATVSFCIRETECK